MELAGRSIIAGDCAERLGAGFNVQNRLNGEPIEPTFYNATESDIDCAAAAAGAAIESFQARSAEDRAAFLEAIAEQIMALGDVLIQRAGAETALPEARLISERGRTVMQLNAFAELIREGSWVEAHIDLPIPDRKPLPKPDVRRMLVPVGPVAVFSASNFPFAFSVAGGDTASALAAGCPVVVKAHPGHPGTSELTARAIQSAAQQCGMPPGIFSMIHGNTPDVGMRLVMHPAIKAIGFTGSLRAGRAIYNAAATRPEPIPVYAEMGSTNPVFVLPGALNIRGPQIAEGMVQSVTLGVGQFCTSPGLVFGLAGEPLPGFTEQVRQCADASAAGTMLTDSLYDQFNRGTDELRRTAGVGLLTSSGQDPSASKVSATVFVTDAATFQSNEAMHEELFGPAAIIVTCDSADEMLQIARNLSGQLTATVHGTEADLEQYRDLLTVLRQKAGRLIINGFPTGVEVCPSMQHGGPYPATTDSRTTSVGTGAIKRFVRPVCFQNFPDSLLPGELQNRNTKRIMRVIDKQFTREDC